MFLGTHACWSPQCCGVEGSPCSKHMFCWFVKLPRSEDDA